MDELNNANLENKTQAEANYRQVEKETVIIKEKSDKFLIMILVFILLIIIGVAYLVYSTVTTLPYDYTIQGINGDTIIFNQTTGYAYYPETRIRISIDDYTKKREGQIFLATSIIPASTDLHVSAQAKASESSILYSIELSFLKSKTSLTAKEIDQKVNELRDSSNNNIIYLNFYDKDEFLLFSKKIAITGGTKSVNSEGLGTGLTLEGSFSEDSVLIGLISYFHLSWSIPILDKPKTQ